MYPTVHPHTYIMNLPTTLWASISVIHVSVSPVFTLPHTSHVKLLYFVNHSYQIRSGGRDYLRWCANTARRSWEPTLLFSFSTWRKTHRTVRKNTQFMQQLQWHTVSEHYILSVPHHIAYPLIIALIVWVNKQEQTLWTQAWVITNTYCKNEGYKLKY